MEYLWKKESTRTGLRYVNFHDFVHNESCACSETHDVIPQYKDNKISTASRLRGNEFFRAQKWLDAMKCYNESLCFAEIGSEKVALAYVNRSTVFFYVNMYQEALIDIDLAKSANLPVNLISEVKQRKQRCLEQIADIGQSTQHVPKLSYDADENFPCLANVVEIKYNAEFGRHLVATADIPTGQTVLVEEMFIKSRENRRIACDTCAKEIGSFIPCPQCPAIVYCNASCMKRNRTHKWECGIGLDRFDVYQYVAIFYVKAILLAIETFKDADSFITFVESVLFEDREKLPISLNEPESKYHFFLKLDASAPCNFDLLDETLKIYSIVMKLPKVCDVFNREDQRCFLMHFIAHIYSITTTNSTGDDESLSVANVMSFLNHSCAPNINHSYIGNVRFCETVRPIRRGEQLFMSYLGVTEEPSAQQRQAELKRIWGFDCKCTRCEPVKEVHPFYRSYLIDPSYKFILDNFEKRDMFTEVLEHCRQFLDKYGHFWSMEIQFIAHKYRYMLAIRAWRKVV